MTIAKAARYDKQRIEPLIALPTVDSISAEGRRNLDSIDRLIGDARACDMQFVLDWLANDPANNPGTQPVGLSQLKHPLSDHFLHLSPPGIWDRRSSAEFDTVIAHGGVTINSVCERQSPAFENFLTQLVSAMSGTRMNVRSSKVRTKRDLAGHYVEYPPAHVIKGRLDVLAQFLVDNQNGSPAFVATVVMNGLCNCHPFPDGNGRLSRMMFNWIMNRLTGSSFYLPLYELSALSDGGFVIRQRQIMRHGEWEPLFEYLKDASAALILR